MTTETERATLLRAIARGGYSPYADNDGSTAEHLENWASELEEQRAAERDAYALLGLWLLSPLAWPWRQARRWYLRLRLRRKMRRLGMIPVVIVAAIVPTATVRPQDSLYQHLPVRYALGSWSPDSARAFCITRYFENGGLLDLIEVAAVDSLSCRRPDGTLTPVFLDSPRCPGPMDESRPYPFLLVRCGHDQYRMVRRREQRTQ